MLIQLTTGKHGMLKSDVIEVPESVGRVYKVPIYQRPTIGRLADIDPTAASGRLVLIFEDTGETKRLPGFPMVEYRIFELTDIR